MANNMKMKTTSFRRQKYSGAYTTLIVLVYLSHPLLYLKLLDFLTYPAQLQVCPLLTEDWQSVPHPGRQVAVHLANIM